MRHKSLDGSQTELGDLRLLGATAHQERLNDLRAVLLQSCRNEIKPLVTICHTWYTLGSSKAANQFQVLKMRLNWAVLSQQWLLKLWKVSLSVSSTVLPDISLEMFNSKELNNSFQIITDNFTKHWFLRKFQSSIRLHSQKSLNAASSCSLNATTIIKSWAFVYEDGMEIVSGLTGLVRILTRLNGLILSGLQEQPHLFQCTGLTSEYVCVSGCNSFDLDNARLCSLRENKKKLELYIQYNIYPSKAAQLYWLRVWLRWPQGRKYLALHAQQLSFSSRELWKKMDFPRGRYKI